MFTYMSETIELASILESAHDFVPSNMLVRLAPVVRWEPKAEKNPKILPRISEETASAFFISRTVMSVSDEQR